MLLLPSVFLQLAIFLQPFWQYRHPAEASLAQRLWTRVNVEVYAVSDALVHKVIATDDGVLRKARTWAGQDPQNTVVIWADGVTDWRKVTYYLPSTPVYVLTSAMDSGARMLVKAQAAHTVTFGQPSNKVRVPVKPGERLIWMLPLGSRGLPELIASGASCEGTLCLQQWNEGPAPAALAGVELDAFSAAP